MFHLCVVAVVEVCIFSGVHVDKWDIAIIQFGRALNTILFAVGFYF